MSKRQSYNNKGFKRLTAVMAALSSFTGNMYNYIFHNKNRNTGKAGGHLDTSYHASGGSGGNTEADKNTPVYRHKATIEKKRRRKEVDKSKSINRKRASGVCSFK